MRFSVLESLAKLFGLQKGRKSFEGSKWIENFILKQRSRTPERLYWDEEPTLKSENGKNFTRDTKNQLLI